MAEVKWIKITTDIFEDEKIRLIDSMPDNDALIVIWFKLLSLAGKTNASGMIMLSNKIPYTEEMLSTIFHRPLNTVRLALTTFERFGMIEIEDDVISIANWEKHQNIDGLDKIREQNRLSQQKCRDKKKQLLLSDDSQMTVTNGHATEVELELEEDKIKNKDIELFFETIWKLYPIKKGKASISKSKKKELHKLGTEVIELCISRYIKECELQETEKQFYKHGSTFFNGGYVDYLDENYQNKEQQSKKGGNYNYGF